MNKFIIGDEIIVTVGKDKGKKGKIEKVYKSEGKITVANVNVYKRHKKASRSQAAGIYEITRPLPLANVALICPKCSKQTRVGFEFEGKSKHRICKKCKGSLI